MDGRPLEHPLPHRAGGAFSCPKLPLRSLRVTVLPSKVPSGPPLTSRAILLVGGLSLFCLALFSALILESGTDTDSTPLQLDRRTEQTGNPAQRPDTAPNGAAQAAEASRTIAAYDAEPHAIRAGAITALEQAAEEPLDVELSRLLDAIQQGFGETSVQVAPALRPYAYRLAGRMNIRPGAYRVRVAAPNEGLAIARAEVLARLFETAGVVSSRLTFVPRTGMHSLMADPA